MTERIGDVVFIETDNKAVIALRGIIAIVESYEEKPTPAGFGFLHRELCTAITIEGGRFINVSPEDGDFVRRCLKDYEREQAAQKTLR